MASTSKNEYWKEFIRLYKSLPELWQVQSDCYKNRKLKANGYDIMVAKLKEINPKANRDMVKKKINTLRTNYRKELRKLEKCEETPDKVYVPSLWYFKYFDFLRTQETGGIDEYTDDEDTTERSGVPTQFWSREFLTVFIEIYKENPCLWQVKHEDYYNRTKKNLAYEQLRIKMLEVDPTATKETVLKKINSLQCCFRKEFKKVQAAMNSGEETQAVYTPTLWYYDLLDFLKIQEESRKRLSSSSLNEDTSEDVIDEQSKSVNGSPISSPRSSVPLTKRRLTQKREMDLEAELMTMARESLRSCNDEADIFGKCWAFQYKKLKPDQQIFAKKAIDDIFFEARLGTLHRHSILINDAPEIQYCTPYAEVDSN